VTGSEHVLNTSDGDGNVMFTDESLRVLLQVVLHDDIGLFERAMHRGESSAVGTSENTSEGTIKALGRHALRIICGAGGACTSGKTKFSASTGFDLTRTCNFAVLLSTGLSAMSDLHPAQDGQNMATNAQILLSETFGNTSQTSLSQGRECLD